MDVKFSTKEYREQPDGSGGYVYIDDIFDLYPIMDGNNLTNLTIVTGQDELMQAALFATIRQKGNDPLNLDAGVRWGEALMGQVSSDAIIADIRENVFSVSAGVAVTFGVDDAGEESTLSYQIRIIQ